MIHVSAQSLSKYENGHQTLRNEVVDRLVAVVGFQRQYFFRPVADTDSRPVFWRSKLSALNADLERAFVRLEWLKEIVDYLGGFFDFPPLDILQLDVPRDPTKITNDFLEEAAVAVRDKWGVRRGLLPDVIEKLKKAGF